MSEKLSAREGIKPNTLNVIGKQVGLGPWLDEYLDNWVQALQDPQLSLFSDGSFLMPTREHEAETVTLARKTGGTIFGIFALPEVKLIGLSGIYKVNQRNRTGELGISIFDKDYWGKGYGTEATKLTVDFGFRFLNLHTIILTTFSYNERAIRAYTKAGFKEIGRWREALQAAGKRYDEVLWIAWRLNLNHPNPAGLNSNKTISGGADRVSLP